MRLITQALSRCVPFVMIAATALSLVPAATLAQYGTAFRNAPHLTSKDIEIIRKIVRVDLEGQPNGTTLPWKNPESQRYGTVTLLDRFPSQGRDCRKVRYVINPGPTADIRTTYVLTSCRYADGTWKVDNAAKSDKSQ